MCMLWETVMYAVKTYKNGIQLIFFLFQQLMVSVPSSVVTSAVLY
uniref:Uncharacterized protein n=1 Tax=Anguilla anguilla TaxID=7936 RepID=A0A0E9WH21_ANGAN